MHPVSLGRSEWSHTGEMVACQCYSSNKEGWPWTGNNRRGKLSPLLIRYLDGFIEHLMGQIRKELGTHWWTFRIWSCFHSSRWMGQSDWTNSLLIDYWIFTCAKYRPWENSSLPVLSGTFLKSYFLSYFQWSQPDDSRNDFLSFPLIVPFDRTGD